MALLGLVACADDPSSACDPARGLMAVEAVLDDPHDDCRAWVESLHGRAVRIDWAGGSGSIWSRRTPAGTGLLTTAAHVVSPCSESPKDVDCVEALRDPRTVAGQAWIRLAEAGSGSPRSYWSAHFAVYNPLTPVDELSSLATRPRYDFSVYAVDNQTFEAWGTGLGIVPEPIIAGLLALDDRDRHTLDEPSWAAAQPGQHVLMLGFPDTGEPVRTMYASVGVVLDDARAEKAIARLQAEGDEEGDIPYDPEAEVLIAGAAAPGMSGSGIFDEQGRQVAIAVRASFAEIDTQYIRGVRMSHVVDSMNAAVASLTASEQAAVAPYLESVTP